jgi:hypothetical protein
MRVSIVPIHTYSHLKRRYPVLKQWVLSTRSFVFRIASVSLPGDIESLRLPLILANGMVALVCVLEVSEQAEDD